MRTFGFADISNIAAVARREFVSRASTRTYLVSTVALVLGAALVALAPVAIGYLNREATRVAVYVGASDLRGDPVATLDAVLNEPGPGGASSLVGERTFTVTRATDLEAGRRQVLEGELNALLDVERDISGSPVFTVYTSERATSSIAVISRQAAASIALADRLGRSSLTPAEQTGLFAAPTVTIMSPDPSASPAMPERNAQQETDAVLVFGLELFLLLALILYGNWVAQSVAEEKSSRMMEIILSAATPFQLLAGKVVGVSAAALVQFVAVVAMSMVALVLEGQVASLLLGGAGLDLPSGLTPSIVIAFSVFFVGGFVLYATVFAAAGSLVSRQEDVNQVVQPMTLIACAGYLIAVYAAIGSLDAQSPIVVALSWVPFLSPYTMVSRVAVGEAGLLEAGIALALLAATVVLTAWLASRVYSAGVLMYGQKPSVRAMWRAVREAR